MLGLKKASEEDKAFTRAFLTFPSSPLPPVSIKACTCATGSCPSHLAGCPPPKIVEPLELHRTPSSRSRLRSSVSRQTICRFDCNKDSGTKMSIGDELRLSLSSLATSRRRPSNVGQSSEGVSFKKWLDEKNQRMKQAEEERKAIEEVVERERLMKFEMERKNFENWLSQKKIGKQRLKQTDSEREEELTKTERERKKIESELHFKLWCKRKEEQLLEKRLKQHIEKIQSEDERKQRLAQNEKAYERWLKDSRYKPRPLPLNRGLDSLRASVSVSYVNPTPWEPNVEKPTTQ